MCPICARVAEPKHAVRGTAHFGAAQSEASAGPHLLEMVEAAEKTGGVVFPAVAHVPLRDLVGRGVGPYMMSQSIALPPGAPPAGFSASGLPSKAYGGRKPLSLLPCLVGSMDAAAPEELSSSRG